MVRTKTAFVSGTILNNPLGAADTTLNSAGLANLPAISSPDIAVLILEPASGNPEVVYVTAHTASATTATISRGEEGSSAGIHQLGGAWVHAPSIMDFTHRKGTDIASAASIALPTNDADYFNITGTTTIAAIVSTARGAGKLIRLRFTGSLTITYNATSMILLDGADVTTQAGDILTFVSEDSNNWRQIAHSRSGTAKQFYAQTQVPNATTISTTVAPVANTAYLVPMIPVTADSRISALVFEIITSSGNADFGIYSWDGITATKVGSTGSIACPASGAYTTQSITATLRRGTMYLFAVAFDNTSARMRTYQGPLIGMTPGLSKTSSFPLPASLTTLSTVAYNGFLPLMFGDIQGVGLAL